MLLCMPARGSCQEHELSATSSAVSSCLQHAALLWCTRIVPNDPAQPITHEAGVRAQVWPSVLLGVPLPVDDAAAFVPRLQGPRGRDARRAHLHAPVARLRIRAWWRRRCGRHAHPTAARRVSTADASGRCAARRVRLGREATRQRRGGCIAPRVGRDSLESRPGAARRDAAPLATDAVATDAAAAVRGLALHAGHAAVVMLQPQFASATHAIAAVGALMRRHCPVRRAHQACGCAHGPRALLHGRVHDGAGACARAVLAAGPPFDTVVCQGCGCACCNESSVRQARTRTQPLSGSSAPDASSGAHAGAQPPPYRSRTQRSCADSAAAGWGRV